MIREARTKAVVLLLLGAAHMFTAPTVLYATLVVSGAMVLSGWSHFRRFRWLFCGLLFLVGVVGLVVWRMTTREEAVRVVHDLVRLLSLSAVTLTIASSMSVLEIAAVVRWVRLPTGIAIATAVCVRFVPVVLHEARQVAFTRRQRGWTMSTMLRRHGVVGAISRAIAPLVVGVLRRTEAIVLAVHLNDLGGRINRFRFRRPQLGDVSAVCAALGVVCYGLVVLARA